MKTFAPRHCHVLVIFSSLGNSSLHCYSLYSYAISMSSTINDVRVAPGESAEAKRERRLQRRRERERAHRASETAEQQEERLSRRRIRDGARRAAQSVEQRQTLLQLRWERLRSPHPTHSLRLVPQCLAFL